MELLLLCEGELSAAEAARAQEHIDSCAECAKTCEQIRLSLKGIRQTAPQTLSETAAARIKHTLKQQRATDITPGHVRPSLIYSIRLVVVAAVVAVAAWWLHQPRLSIEVESEPKTDFERAALTGYAGYLKGSIGFDLETSSPQEARTWIRRLERRFDAPLATFRAAEEERRFRLQGLKVIPYQGKQALMVVYRIDGRDVVLLTAPASDVGDAPRAGLLSKDIHFAASHDLKILSWKSSGEVYTLVSDLPGKGMQSCFICHTDATRRRLIEQAEQKNH
jgi:anti-sigma factor RsiW